MPCIPATSCSSTKRAWPGRSPSTSSSAIASQRGALVRLIGDDRQLSAVESGGALRLIAHEAGAAELTALYRFADPAEAEATLKLRIGDASGLDYYLARGRVRSGSREAMTEAAYAGWRADMLAGKTTLMTAASGTDVTALSAQARTERVDAGQVESDGVPLRDGTLAGRGDWIVTRQNNRKAAVNGGRDWVKNGDAWRVIKRHRNGALGVEHLVHRGRVTLPADYVDRPRSAAVRDHCAPRPGHHGGHGARPDHPGDEPGKLLRHRVPRPPGHHLLHRHPRPPSPDEDDRLDAARTDPRSYAAREVLENVLAREGAELSATESIQVAQEQAGSLATLVPRYNHAAQLVADARYRRTALEVLGADPGHLLVSDPAWGAVVRALQDAEALGWRAGQLLTEVVDLRELATARSMAEVIAWRVDAFISDRPAPPRLDEPTEADALRYAGLLRALPAFDGADARSGCCCPAATPMAAGFGADTEIDATNGGRAAPIADMVTGVLGATLAGRARSEPAWPALDAALRRAQRRGHDPAALLGRLAGSRELRTARSISEVLSWRIGGYLATEHSVAAEDPGSGARHWTRGPGRCWPGR